MKREAWPNKLTMAEQLVLALAYVVTLALLAACWWWLGSLPVAWCLYWRGE